MLRNPFMKALRDARRGLAGWAVGLGLVAVMYAAFYPSMSTPAIASAMKNYPESIKKALNLEDITSPAGYLGSYIFGLLMPVLLAIFTVIMGSRTIAGDEEAGILDLLLAHPVSRTRLVLSRLGALAAEIVIICIVVLLMLLAILHPAKLASVGTGNLGAAVLQLAVLGMCFAALAVAVGALTGRRAASVGVSVVVLVAGYFGNNLAPRVSGLHWAQKLSPFYWYAGGQPLVHGVQWASLGLLLAVTAALTAIAVAGLARRDIAV